ncbi:uncharacterized protein LOC34621702 [Cyclospora cayetanensis]|uniref:Uncharacterized protein LOC34621702 n=1 Tax=Cyclospora cayetanensis TaxID=88456 RepID=A0A6P6RQF9_9EIME|nr:uncharacterized protein LOC34621702 [Cyclospora cayetanensis]
MIKYGRAWALVVKVYGFQRAWHWKASSSRHDSSVSSSKLLDRGMPCTLVNRLAVSTAVAAPARRMYTGCCEVCSSAEGAEPNSSVLCHESYCFYNLCFVHWCYDSTPSIDGKAPLPMDEGATSFILPRILYGALALAKKAYLATIEGFMNGGYAKPPTDLKTGRPLMTQSFEGFAAALPFQTASSGIATAGGALQAAPPGNFSSDNPSSADMGTAVTDTDVVDASTPSLSNKASSDWFFWDADQPSEEDRVIAYSSRSLWRPTKQMTGVPPPRTLLSEGILHGQVRRSINKGRGGERSSVFSRIVGWPWTDPAIAEAEAVSDLARKVHHWNSQRHRKPGSKTKLIFAMRHAESEFNVWRRESFMKLRFRDMLKRDWGECDVQLSPEGQAQCKRANEKLKALLAAVRDLEEDEKNEGISISRPFCIDAFLVSPLVRALQTAANSFHEIDSSWHCSSTNLASARQKRSVTWIVDSILREKLSTMGDVGTERCSLLSRLADLHKQGKLQSSTFDFGLVPESEKWWVPDTAEQIRALVENCSYPKGSGSSWSDTQSTSASETGQDAGDAVFIVGSASKHPLSVAESSIKKTFELAERPARDPDAARRRMMEWEERSARLPFYQTVPEESNDLLQLRGTLLLSILCRAELVDTAFIVTHSLFLKALTGTKKFANAEIRAFTLVCDKNPRLVPL